MKMMMPPGFQFEPSDEVLIHHYLLMRAMDQPLPWNCILERNIYGKDNAPWDLFADVIDDPNSFYCHTNRDDGGKKTIYVFTNLVKVSPNAKRFLRRAGSGTWGGQTAPKKIISSRTGEVIGTTKMFQYQPDSTFGHWIMHEYSSDGVSLTENNIINKDLVLCKITRILKSNKRNGSHQERASVLSDMLQDQTNGGDQERALVESDILQDQTNGGHQEPFSVSDNLQDRNLVMIPAQPSSSSNNKRSLVEDDACDQQLMKKQRTALYSPNDDLCNVDQHWTESELFDIDALLGGMYDEPLSSFVHGQPSSICLPH